jgi:hypothetical protein
MKELSSVAFSDESKKEFLFSNEGHVHMQEFLKRQPMRAA